eukprot:TRINITY_DN41743_c0_g1_i2.p1 TRINITY_DN41743_c0_g1~~TRINITY_DN41743_c0_g1_i2.p1  ORF type:complete len:566 (-),score=96.11 TRINITY_DN41743_c0_g1_i2:509-2206(-)
MVASHECSLRRGLVLLNSAAAASATASRWQKAARAMDEALQRGLQLDYVTCNACLTATDAGSQWRCGLAALQRLSELRLPAGANEYSLVLGLLEKTDHQQNADSLLKDLQDRFPDESGQLLWAHARMASCPDSAVERLAEQRLAELTSGCAPEELSRFAWCVAMLRPIGRDRYAAFSDMCLARLEDFGISDLALLVWSLAVLDIISGAVASALEESILSKLSDGASEGASHAAAHRHFDSLRRLLWSLHFAGRLSEGLRAALTKSMLAIGALFDSARPRAAVCHVKKTPIAATGADESSEPRIVEDLGDRLVVFKPPGWEVYDAHSRFAQKQLSTFVRATSGHAASAISDDPAWACGFLHRLDVPSSGLIVAAKTYAAYSDLTAQLNSGGMAREYVVICHGFVSPPRRRSGCAEIVKPLRWTEGNSPTFCCQSGRPSRTELKVLAHMVNKPSAQAFSLAAVRIQTGRRHQIRSHLSHMGHSVVTDGLYSASPTYSSDARWCARNALHRCRLAFRDSSGALIECSEVLPLDMKRVLKSLVGKEAASVREMQRVEGGIVRAWDALQT